MGKPRPIGRHLAEGTARAGWCRSGLTPPRGELADLPLDGMLEAHRKLHEVLLRSASPFVWSLRGAALSTISAAACSGFQALKVKTSHSTCFFWGGLAGALPWPLVRPCHHTPYRDAV